MIDDSNAPADLSNIGIDLSQIFRPAWTVESSDATARLAAKFDDDERTGRQGGGNQREGRRREGRNNQAGSRDRDNRGPRPQFPARDARTGQRGQGVPSGKSGHGGPGDHGKQSGQDKRQGEPSKGRNKDSRDRRQEDRRPEPPQKPVLEGWKITLIPEPSALEAIAKQIRSRAKAYPLFELARLIVRLSDRYRIRLTAASETSPVLFRVKIDGSLWTSQRAAITHLLSRHLEKFYRRSSVTVESPKGSYTVVAQCGMSGVLLGPPNHHEYQSRLLALHAGRFKNLPFEVYKTRIKMMRDDALMEQWKTEQTTRTVYIPIRQEAEQIVEAPTPQPAIGDDSTTPGATEDIAPRDVIPSETPSGETSAPDQAPESTPEAIPSDATEEKEGFTLEEATAHFHAHHAAAAIEPAGSEITLAGRVALHESDPLLRELLLGTLQELDHFPLPLAQIVGKELTSSGLQIFKAQKKIIHVSVARPRYLDRATTPTSEGFRKILDYLEAHPNQQRDKQWTGLLAQITEPAGEDAESIQRREQALGADLIWLLHQGHVIDFAMGNLQAALPPTPRPASATKSLDSGKSDLQAAAAVTESAESAQSALEEEEIVMDAPTETAEAVEKVEAPQTSAAIEPDESADAGFSKALIVEKHDALVTSETEFGVASAIPAAIE
jgi:hypothetical protein